MLSQSGLDKIIQLIPFGWKYKASCFGLFLLAHTFFYTVANVSPFFPPQLIPLLDVDRFVPLLPWTFLIYVSDYVFMVTMTCLHTDRQAFNSMVRMCFTILVICGLVFIFFPTTYPRPPYPDSGNILVNSIMKLVGSADTPNNCFPSLHVGLTGGAAWSVRSWGVRKCLPFWIWAVAIFISTLTTKQHYFVDIGGGVAVVTLVAFLEWAIFEKRAFSVAFKYIR